MSSDIKSDINEYIEDWLEKVKSEKSSIGEIKKIQEKTLKETSEETSQETSQEKTLEDLEDREETLDKQEKLQNKSKVDKNKIKNKSKIFKQLNFEEKWRKKLLSDDFILYGIDSKRYEKYLTLEMAIYNSGYSSKITDGSLKRIILKYIKDLTQWEFLQFLDQYKMEKTSNTFTGKWDPFGVKNKNDFIKEFRSPHFTLENDSIMMSLLSKILGIDFVILHQNYCIQDLSDKKLNDKIIFLYKFKDDDNNIYFCCIGLKNNKKRITKIFNRERLPKIIQTILNKDEFIYQHILQTINDLERQQIKLRLNDIINKLELTLCSNFSHIEIRGIIKIINSILNEKQYFEIK